MINKKYLKNLRCKEINSKNNFFFDLYNERILDSIDILTINFNNILILGNHSKKIYEYVQKKFKGSKITVCDFVKLNLKKKNFDNIIENIIDLDLWKGEQDKYNLIISNHFLNLSNDINVVFKSIMRSLAPNGFFIATLPSADNFYNLKVAMINTDINLYGGVYNRFEKYFELQNITQLLRTNDFKIPIIKLEKIDLEYKNFSKLLNDVRSMQLTYSGHDKKNKFEKKDYFIELEKNYKKNLQNNFPLSTNFFVISGWKYHYSQQKPLKPGEAKNKLQDYL
tara:strand:- start:1524 stop:2366 length:843 start_codon:yes stop_codon:yes gene_type:complete